MKKFISVMMILIILLGLVGCGSSGETLINDCFTGGCDVEDRHQAVRTYINDVEKNEEISFEINGYDVEYYLFNANDGQRAQVNVIYTSTSLTYMDILNDIDRLYEVHEQLKPYIEVFNDLKDMSLATGFFIDGTRDHYVTFTEHFYDDTNHLIIDIDGIEEDYIEFMLDIFEASSDIFAYETLMDVELNVNTSEAKMRLSTASNHETLNLKIVYYYGGDDQMTYAAEMAHQFDTALDQQFEIGIVE